MPGYWSSVYSLTSASKSSPPWRARTGPSARASASFLVRVDPLLFDAPLEADQDVLDDDDGPARLLRFCHGGAGRSTGIGDATSATISDPCARR